MDRPRRPADPRETIPGPSIGPMLVILLVFGYLLQFDRRQPTHDTRFLFIVSGFIAFMLYAISWNQTRAHRRRVAVAFRDPRLGPPKQSILSRIGNFGKYPKGELPPAWFRSLCWVAIIALDMWMVDTMFPEFPLNTRLIAAGVVLVAVFLVDRLMQKFR